MPSSTWAHTSTVQDLVWKYQPQTVLDLGVGFGRWGFLIREQLDIFRGRYKKEEWKTHITGVEAWNQYVMWHHKDIYNEIVINDAMTFFKNNPERKFDLIIAGDVLEHFERKEGERFLAEVRKRANKAAIFCVPLGDKYPQGAALGNNWEKHQSVWVEKDFADATRVTVIKERIKSRPYGVILFDSSNKKDDVVF